MIRYLVYLLTVTCAVTSMSLSRYKTSSSGDNTARIAHFAYSYEITDPNSALSGAIDPSIYATCKLAEAGTCDFDKVVIVREIEVTNGSEVAVRPVLSITSRMSESEGIVWCVLEDLPVAVVDENKIADAIAAKLSGPVPNTLLALQTELESANAATLSDWNDTALGYTGQKNNTSSVIIVFWAEHDTFSLSGETPPDLATESLDFQFTVGVSQID